jgi:membrane-bound metal-dependent hydrolase YbcI (DUF457 family)
MTPVGHTLVGAAIGMISLPKKSRGYKKYFHLFSFIVLANLPDLPVPMWGHKRYDISHSIFISFLLITLFILLLSLVSTYIFHRQINRWILFWGAIAVLSHLMLDSFYNHGLGIPIFWPFSDKSLVLSIPWLSVQKDIPPPITMEMVRIWLYEFITFGPILLVSIWVKKLINHH